MFSPKLSAACYLISPRHSSLIVNFPIRLYPSRTGEPPPFQWHPQTPRAGCAEEHQTLSEIGNDVSFQSNSLFWSADCQWEINYVAIADQAELDKRLLVRL